MKKLLFIAYQIPPISGAATQRHIRFLNELHKFGWEAVILTGKIRDYENYYTLDRKLRGLLPVSLSVHRARNINPFEKFATYKILPFGEMARPLGIPSSLLEFEIFIFLTNSPVAMDITEISWLNQFAIYAYFSSLSILITFDQFP